MTNLDWDACVRTASFEWLSAQVGKHGDVLPKDLLLKGFELDGKRIPLMSGAKGIFKPKVLEHMPLSLMTSPNSPYDDRFGMDDLLRYRYRGKDPKHRDNVGLIIAMEKRLPLVYFHGIIPGRYMATWPVYVVAANPEELSFSVAVDDAARLALGAQPAGEDRIREANDDARRRYITTVVRARLHQRAFRERVLEAYKRQCAFCRFKHVELLDAAHIAPDKDPEGDPVVNNGLSLCRIHHAAFDRYFLGVTPDYEIKVRPDLMDEVDGPTLVHSIQALDGKRIVLPRRKQHYPMQDLLALRYERFIEAGTTAQQGHAG
ncbi:MAG: HNH endonuclease [Dehalococcoidia bacterium]